MGKKNKKDNDDLRGGIFTNILFLILLILVFLIIGAIGYYLLDKPDWIDATYSAASIMTGVGSADEPVTHAAKLFSIPYILATNLLFLFIVGYVVQFYLRKSESEEKE